MDLQEIIEKTIRNIVAEQLDNNDKFFENLVDRLRGDVVSANDERLVEMQALLNRVLANIGSLVLENQQLKQKLETFVVPANLEFRVARLEDKDFLTRSQVKDIAFETVRDADMDVLFGSYVEDKIEEVLDDDEFRDRLHDIIDEKLERVEISLKVV